MEKDDRRPVMTTQPPLMLHGHSSPLASQERRSPGAGAGADEGDDGGSLVQESLVGGSQNCGGRVMDKYLPPLRYSRGSSCDQRATDDLPGLLGVAIRSSPIFLRHSL